MELIRYALGFALRSLNKFFRCSAAGPSLNTLCFNTILQIVGGGGVSFEMNIVQLHLCRSVLCGDGSFPILSTRISLSGDAGRHSMGEVGGGWRGTSKAPVNKPFGGNRGEERLEASLFFLLLSINF